MAGVRRLGRLTLLEGSSSSSTSATGPREGRTTLGSIRLTAGSPLGLAGGCSGWIDFAAGLGCLAPRLFGSGLFGLLGGTA